MLSPGRDRSTQSPGNLGFKRNEKSDTQFLLEGNLHSRIFRHATDECDMIRQCHPSCHHNDSLGDACNKTGCNILLRNSPRTE
jgi:hypothetical protein